MTDGISEAYRAKRKHDEWNAPRCLVCFEKFDEGELFDHMFKEHSIGKIVKCLADFSIGVWKNDNTLFALENMKTEIKRKQDESYEKFKKWDNEKWPPGRHIEGGKHRAFGIVLNMLEKLLEPKKNGN